MNLLSLSGKNKIPQNVTTATARLSLKVVSIVSSTLPPIIHYLQKKKADVLFLYGRKEHAICSACELLPPESNQLFIV